MTSNDNTLEVHSIALQLRELIATNREQIAEMKALAAQIQKDNAEFRSLMVQEFANFKDNINKEFSAFSNNVNAELSGMHSEISGMHSEIGLINQRITGIEHDIAGLYHWDYWLLSIIIAVVAMPQIISGVKALFAAVAEGIAGIISVFKKGSK